MKLTDVLTGPEAWCQNCSAKDANGKPVLADSPYAVTFCLFGSTFKAYPDREERSAALSKLQDALSASGYGFSGGLTFWNDKQGRTFADVRELIEKAGV